jgi:tetratricopeptide (TPR) repeat protein
VAKSITREIQAIITPQEAEQIEKIPTENLEAYDYFMKGLEFFYQETRSGLLEAIPLFEKAIELDPEFARAHADLSIAYAFLDIFQAEKLYLDKIDYHADQALLSDPKLPQSLYAKAMYHYVREEYDLALPYLEKALEYHPNSSQVINILADYYSRFVANTEKYLEYALMGLELDIAANDSVEASNIYLNLSNAFMQSGFIEEAEEYIELSRQYNPENIYINLLRAYIQLADGGTLPETREMLEQELQKDTNRLDILKELGVLSYYMRDFESAYGYFSSLFEITTALGLELYGGEKGKLAVSLDKLGRSDESQRYFKEFLELAEDDQGIYKNLSLAVYYSYVGDTARAIENMKLFKMLGASC